MALLDLYIMDRIGCEAIYVKTARRVSNYCRELYSLFTNDMMY